MGKNLRKSVELLINDSVLDLLTHGKVLGTTQSLGDGEDDFNVWVISDLFAVRWENEKDNGKLFGLEEVDEDEAEDLIGKEGFIHNPLTNETFLLVEDYDLYLILSEVIRLQEEEELPLEGRE